ncbi:hypothetical protein H0H93_010814 [Arthromyces matolae]|nr:hypothetical protein H0H93_010814 [Arthromyces matolae]
MASKRKSAASTAGKVKKARLDHTDAIDSINTILADETNFPTPIDQEGVRKALLQIALYARSLEEQVQESKPKERSTEELQEAAKKIRAAARSGIRKQMTWKPSCKTGSARFVYDGVCADAVLFGAFLGLEGPPTWKTKKIPKDEFESLGGTAGAARGPAAAGREEESTFKKFFTIAQYQSVHLLAVQATRFFAPSADKPVVPKADDPSPPPSVDPWSLPPQEAYLDPAWPLGQQFDMHVRLTTAPLAQVYNTPNLLRKQDKGLPTFVWSNITFGDWNAAYTAEFEVQFPENFTDLQSVLNNGTLWMDVFLAKDGAVPDTRHENFKPENIHHVRKLLTPYLTKVKTRREKKLLGGADGPETEVEELEENITLALISDTAKLPYGSLPLPILERWYLSLADSHMENSQKFTDVVLTPERDSTATKGFYRPIVYTNEFWHLREYYVELNSTTPSLPLQVTFQPMSYFKFQMFASLTSGFKEAAKQQGAAAGAELDELKRMLIETNPWFLALTGLIITNVFIQVVVLLYLIDNNDNTSWMILFGSGTGVLVEAWKVTKAVDIKLAPAPADKHVLNEDEKKTQEYRWIYRVDPKRINEYGQVMVQDVAAVEEQETKKKQ